MIKNLKFTDMTKAMKGLLSGLLMVLATLSYGSNEPYFKVEVTGQRTFSLQVENLTGTTRISLQDTNGEMVYKEQIASVSTYTKQFDVTSLPKGNYTLIVEDDFKRQSAKISVADQLVAEFDELYFFPLIVQDGKYITVSKIASANERLSVVIYDVNDKLLFSEVLQGQDFLGKRFDFSKAPKGTYKIFLASNGHALNRRVVIQ